MRRVGAVLLMLGVAATVLSSCAPAQPDALHVERVVTGTGVGRFDPFDRIGVDAARYRLSLGEAGRGSDGPRR